MSFIKVQKLVTDNQGRILSGSASIVDSVYDKAAASGHSRQEVRENLGKVIRLSPDLKNGMFLSPTRGLVFYDAMQDAFSPATMEEAKMASPDLFPEAAVHTVFGDSYLLFSFMEECGLLSVLQAVFPKKEDYERMLCHLLHGVLKDGSKISCDNFIQKSFASYVLSDIPVQPLKSDTRFFSMLGDDKVKMSFFSEFVALMRKTVPEFGHGCYVDSTPLPNDIEDNPFNALCCHGVNSSEVMSRLILVLDTATGLPVWYDIIPGNVLDINTVMTTVNDVAASLGIEIESLVLDAGYVSRELVDTYHIGSTKTVIGRMPARRGFPFKELYWETKGLMDRGKYAFVRNGHAYFGYKKEIELFGQREFAYVYVDKFNALKRFSDYMTENEEEYECLKAKDKDWMTVKYGFFVLVSNLDDTPKSLLSNYFGRTEVEVVFKTSKEYLGLLPLSKWTDETVRGKILHDIIDTIALLLMRKQLMGKGVSVSELLGKCQSLMCFKDRNNYVTVETPNKQVKEYYKLFNMEVPSRLKLGTFTKQIFRQNV